MFIMSWCGLPKEFVEKFFSYSFTSLCMDQLETVLGTWSKILEYKIYIYPKSYQHHLQLFLPTSEKEEGPGGDSSEKWIGIL